MIKNKTFTLDTSNIKGFTIELQNKEDIFTYPLNLHLDFCGIKSSFTVSEIDKPGSGRLYISVPQKAMGCTLILSHAETISIDLENIVIESIGLS